MVKRTIRSAIIFFGIISIVPVFGLVRTYWESISWMILPHGDGLASATTWLDANANGLQDAGEGDLPDVCVWGEYSLYGGAVAPDPCAYSRTDQQGGWGQFLPGGECSEFYVFASPPAGFHATTDLVSGGCEAKFGFVQDDVPVNHRVLSIRDYIQQQDRFDSIKRIITTIIVLVLAIVGTVWLEKQPKERS